MADCEKDIIDCWLRKCKLNSRFAADLKSLCHKFAQKSLLFVFADTKKTDLKCIWFPIPSEIENTEINYNKRVVDCDFVCDNTDENEIFFYFNNDHTAYVPNCFHFFVFKLLCFV